MLGGGATQGGAKKGRDRRLAGGRGSPLSSCESSGGRGAGAGSRAVAGAGVGAGTGSNDMGSADSKLNFRKAVIQLTTKTQVRPGPRPLRRPTCRAGGWAGPGRLCELGLP